MFDEVKKRALKMLDRRDYSRRELEKKLTEKGEDPDESAAVAEYFESVGLIDDARYAAMLARHYASKGCGKGRIQTELYRRGIDRELWDTALAELPETDDRAYRQFCARMHGAAPERNLMKKAADALYRRGFSWDEIHAAAERYSNETEEEN